MSSGENDPKKRRLHDLEEGEEEVGDQDQDDDTEFEIERIVSRRLVEGTEDTFEYEIKWLGYPTQQNTWQREETLDSCKFWLAEFTRAEEFREELEELKGRERSKSRSAMMSMVTAPSDTGSVEPKQEVITKVDTRESGTSSSSDGVGSSGGMAIQIKTEPGPGWESVKIKTEPGLESEKVVNSGRPHEGFPDTAHGQGHQSHHVPHRSLKAPTHAQLQFQEANNALALSMMKSKLEEKDKEIADLKKELLTFKLRNCMADSKLDKQRKELDQAQAEVLQLKTHLFQKDGLLSQLTPELRDALNQVELLVADSSRKDGQIASLKQGLRDHEKTHHQLNLRLSGARQMVLDLQLKVDDLLRSNEQVKINLLNKEELIRSLNREQKLRKEEMDAQLETLTQAKSDISDLSERVSELQFQLGAMQTENDQLRDNLSLTIVRMGNCEKEREILRKLYNEMINSPTEGHGKVPRWNDR